MRSCRVIISVQHRDAESSGISEKRDSAGSVRGADLAAHRVMNLNTTVLKAWSAAHRAIYCRLARCSVSFSLTTTRTPSSSRRNCVMLHGLISYIKSRKASSVSSPKNQLIMQTIELAWLTMISESRPPAAIADRHDATR